MIKEIINMHITPIGISFGRLIKINKEGIHISTQESTPSEEKAVVASSYSTVQAVESTGSAMQITATAFSSQASGINSSGIVPASIAFITPYSNPSVVLFSQEHPSTTSLILYSSAGILNPKNKIKEEDTNIPS